MRFFAVFGAVPFLLIASLGFAKPATNSNDRTTLPDMMETAKRESQGTLGQGPPQERASDAQIHRESGLLKLKDPGLARVEPDWRWLVGLRVQSLTPGGSATLSNGQSMNLGQVGSTAYPLAEIGVARSLYRDDNAHWSLIVRGEGGYMSQASDVTYVQTGVKAQSSYLTTNLLGAAAIGSVRLLRLPWAEFELGWNEGAVNYTQTAASNQASFNESGRYGGAIVGAMFWVTNSMAISLEDERRSLRSATTTIELQQDNFSLGVRALW